MKITGICFTRSGAELAGRMHRWFTEQNRQSEYESVHLPSEADSAGLPEVAVHIMQAKDPYVDRWFCKGKLFREEMPEGFTFVEESTADWAGKYFADSDAMIFIGAAGICIRAIAPYVKDKKTDPAVLVFDEKGTFGISLLSGHIGGANALTEKLCKELGSIPVITTATDVNRKFAVDVYATQQHLAIGSMELAKDAAAALVEGKTIPFSADKKIHRIGPVPGGLEIRDSAELKKDEKDALGIHVSPFTDHCPYEETLQLIPKCITLGIGCRKNTPVENIEDLVEQVLTENHIHPAAVSSIATIDLKKDEPGLLEFCRRRNLPLTVYSAEELQAVEGEFSSSSFVSGITGVDNVCERSAVKKSGGTLIVNKTKGDSSTCAAALEDWSIKI